jgi:serine/threonine protein kinase
VFPIIEGPPEGYQILEVMGRGPVSMVHRAIDLDGREVALKHYRRPQFDRDVLPRPETISAVAHNILVLMTDRPLRSRLETLRTLTCPFLQGTLACYLTPDEMTLVTELAEGDLRTWLRDCQRRGQAGIPLAPLLRYLGEAAEALDYLGSRNLTHHGLSPSNLLLLRGHIRVADLMQWWPTGDDAPMVGVPLYLSPEEWRGSVSGASDQYRLAVIYCHMRTGRPPIATTNLSALMRCHLEGLLDLSAVPWAERVVLQRALAREPGERFGSCAELMGELKAVVAPDCVYPPEQIPALDPAWVRWNDGCAAKLARAIDEENRFEDMPILADALEDAGCGDRDILGHCRSAETHFRGCWVLDLLLPVDHDDFVR